MYGHPKKWSHENFPNTKLLSTKTIQCFRSPRVTMLSQYLAMSCPYMSGWCTPWKLICSLKNSNWKTIFFLLKWLLFGGHLNFSGIYISTYISMYIYIYIYIYDICVYVHTCLRCGWKPFFPGGPGSFSTPCNRTCKDDSARQQPGSGKWGPTDMGGTPKMVGFPPNHPFVHRVFHYFHHPFWGFSPYFWKWPGWNKLDWIDIPINQMKLFGIEMTIKKKLDHIYNLISCWMIAGDC